MIQPSDEQLAIAENIVNNDIVVDAVAGSGKTTTILHIASVTSENILLLTYNSKLRRETQARSQHLNNLEVHTYHSFGYLYISKKCATDAGFMDLSNQQLNLPSYDVLIVDECQDMTALYSALVKRISHRRLCLLGDVNQSIYAFAGADERFITLSDRVFGRRFMKLPLSTSYRVTQQVASFVNYLMGKKRLHAIKSGPLPVYNIVNPFNCKPIYRIVVKLVAEHGVENVFVLAPSVKSRAANNPVNKLANMLSANGVKIFVPSEDDSRLDEEVCASKLVFCSFHQSKGLERTAVVVLGFDASYYTYYSKESPDKCNNALYVALTRSTNILHVFHANNQRPLSFVRKDVLKYVQRVGSMLPTVQNKIVARPLSVTKLTSQLSSSTLERCMQTITCTVLRHASELIDLPVKAEQFDDKSNWCEHTSDINGVAIPAYYQFKKTGSAYISDFTSDKNLNDIPNLLECSNNYLACREDLIFKTVQIKQYTWLTQDVLDQSYTRLARELSNDELKMEVNLDTTIDGQKIQGVADVLSHRILEIKAVSELQPEHFLQVAVYGYMSAMNGLQLPCHLYNVRSDELWHIDFDVEKMTHLLRYLIAQRTGMPLKITDEEFLSNLA